MKLLTNKQTGGETISSGLTKGNIMEQLFEKKLCFVPKDYPLEDVYFNDDRFLSLAFRKGKVLSVDEFEGKWLHNQSQFHDCHLKVLEVYKTTWELCPHCENEVELKSEWGIQKCPVCGELITPCSLCFPYCDDCSNCELEKLIKQAKGIANRQANND